MKIITIDGPASSGKGTVAKIIAKKLNFHYLDSGAIYRVVAFIAHKHNFSVTNIEGIVELIDSIKLEFDNNQIFINGEDVTYLIRGEKIGMLASSIAGNAMVRNKLLSFQHGFAQEPGLVTDGRDMGSVVFPKATLKVFLTASAETRAKRRFTQVELVDASITYDTILNDIIKRDLQDSERAVAPLKYDSSFHVVDNSDMTIDETVEAIIGLLEK